jgi:LemA protein
VLVALAVTALVAAAAVALLYNALVRTRQRVREGWGAIDVQLQRRASLVPNLVETVRAYAEYERDTLESITQARSSLRAAPGPTAAAKANADLSLALGKLFAVAEAYPDLKASSRFAQLQADLTETENLIAFARNYYNGAVEAHNIRVESFPGLIVARMFGFLPAEFFAAEERAVPVVPSARPR